MAQASSSPFAVRIKASGNNQALPAWVPPEGHFASISKNTMHNVRPSGWPSSDVAGPFANWSGGVYAPDFSTFGAYVVYGSGHLSPGSPLWAGVWCFDLDTLQWAGRNIPSQPLLENGPSYNQFGESTVAATLGHPYPPHTYDGLVFQPSAMGGGSMGALLRCFMAGSGWKNAVHRFDLSSTSAPPTRVVDDLAMTSPAGSYPMSAADVGRGGVWLLAANGMGPLKFLSFSNWSVTTYAGIEYNEYGDQSLIYIPAPYDCLVGMGRSGSGGANMGVWVCPIVNNVPQGFSRVTQSGTAPSDRRCGGVWSTLLNCVVSYQASGSATVHKLTPPSVGNLRSAAWTWTTETLIGAGGATPSHAINTNNGLGFDNGAWGRFVEVPAARCFIWCDGVQQPVQAWRLTGM